MAYDAASLNFFRDAADPPCYLDLHAGPQHLQQQHQHSPQHQHQHPHPHPHPPQFVNPSLQDSAAPPAYYNPNVPPPHHMSCDIKPRLTKEQHDILESHYQKQSKPNTNTKKGFAESLNVSLDKVNNWFQNRRAKAKQDAKKQAGAYNLFAQKQNSSLSLSSDSESSPAFTSSDYYSMMQQCTSADDQNIAMSDMSPFQEQQQQQQPNGLPYSSAPSSNDPFDSSHLSQQLSADLFDSPQDMNRRTLTQEQFDAFAQNGGMMQSGEFDPLQHGFSGDADVLHQVFPDVQNGHFKSHDPFAFPAPIGTPLSSNDSSVPSTISEQSMFPSSTSMQDQATLSATSSEWADSRSSSVSVAPSQDSATYQQASAAPQQSAIATSQWQPGQSIPVDPSDLQQQFRDAQWQAQQQAQQPQSEQPLAWPADEAFVRRDSQNGTMLAQQMSSFAIQTPQSQQTATFRCPAPPGEATGGIAARRQRPRPAALGLASLRSQSYSGAVQPASPSHAAQSLAPAQQLRRIRSSNVINGIAQGRVMKSMPGSAQRSPLSWSFADAMNSPKAVRHASTPSVNNLAPPTPMSPSEMPMPAPEQARPHFPPWQSNGHFSRQASISETDAEHQVPMMSNGSMQQQQNVSSPPHTPMYHHHQQYPQNLASARVGNNVIAENTPPQSAPAVQQSFPADVFMLPQQHSAATQSQQAPSCMPSQSQQQSMNVSMAEQQFQVPAYGSGQGFAVPTSEAQQQMPMHFANGVPVVNAQGQLTMAFPPQMQFVQHAPPQVQNLHQAQPQAGQYHFMAHNGITAGAQQITAQMPRQQSQPVAEFFVHEYTPPHDMKRSATQRKVPADCGPKNYTFANQGPEHFGKEKVKRGQEAKNGTANSSPSSAASSS